ncbi:MAG: hypothetical protein J6S74_04040, partial [Alphaproteobacteria bacterium]|nr:hypothetical protein [Alphaproteobacteria bacterium]
MANFFEKLSVTIGRTTRAIFGIVLLFCAFSTTNAFATTGGYTCDENSTIYTSCKPGYYMTMQGSYYGTPTVGNDCTICPAGYKCPGGVSDKVLCPAGTYQASTGQSACSTLPAGYWSNANCGAKSSAPTSSSNCANSSGGAGRIAAGYYGTAGATSSTGNGVVEAGYYSTGGCKSATPTTSSHYVSGGGCGVIAAGYFSTGGATSATPNTTAGGVSGTGSNGCLSGYSCGAIMGGYYSTGGGTYSHDGCLSGYSCGVLGGGYYSSGGGTNATPTANGTGSGSDGCISAHSCGMVQAGYWVSSCGTTSTGGHGCAADLGGTITAGYFSTGGATSPTPNNTVGGAAGTGSNGCLAGYTCGKVSAGCYGAAGATTACPNTCAAKTYSTGGATSCSSCPTTYPNSAAGTTTQNNCYLTTTPGMYLISANVGTGTQTTCPAGYYCPGGITIYKGGTHSSTHLTYGGSSQCGDGTYNPSTGSSASSACLSCATNTKSEYTHSDGSRNATSTCYLTTDATKYVATANANQVACAAGGYCPGSVKVYYGSTGGRTACGDGTFNSNTGSSASSACVSCTTNANSDYIHSDGSRNAAGTCYLNTTAEKYVAALYENERYCAKGGYCPGSVKVYYGSTGGRTPCPANSYCVAGVSAATSCSTLAGGFYPNSEAGSDEAADCKTNSISGQYVVANASSATNCGNNTKYKGSHQVNYGSASSCATVDTGYYTTGGTSTTRTGETKCEAGNYCVNGVKSACNTLGGGLYVNSAAGSDGSNDCYITIAEKKYLESATSTSVSTCTAGNYCTGGNFYYSSTATNQGLTQCPANSYCTEGVSTHSTCTAGTSGTYTLSSAGTTTIYNCYLKTTATKYVTSGDAGTGTQSTCPAGYYCPGNVVIYRGGTHSSSHLTYGGATVCAAGKYSAAGASSCSNVDAGYFCTGGCTSKTPNTTVGGAAGTGSNGCISGKTCGKVSAGCYGAAGATTACPTVCGANTYSTGGASSCTSCPGSMTTSGTAAANHDANSDCQITCSAGQHLAASASACSACPAGKYCEGGTFGFSSSAQGITGNVDAGYYAVSGCKVKSPTSSSNYISGGSCGQCPSNWTSAAGATAQTSCYRSIVLNKNGASGTINGTSGTSNASQTCYYNTDCSLPVTTAMTLSNTIMTGGWCTTSSCTSSTRTFKITDTASTVTYYAGKSACSCTNCT